MRHTPILHDWMGVSGAALAFVLLGPNSRAAVVAIVLWELERFIVPDLASFSIVTLRVIDAIGALLTGLAAPRVRSALSLAR